MIWRLLLVSVGLCAATPAAAPRFTISGQPIMGSFAVMWEPDDVRQALAIGINLFYCYDRRAGSKLLHPRSEMGAMLQKAGAKSMYNFGEMACHPRGRGLGHMAELVPFLLTPIGVTQHSPGLRAQLATLGQVPRPQKHAESVPQGRTVCNAFSAPIPRPGAITVQHVAVTQHAPSQSADVASAKKLRCPRR